MRLDRFKSSLVEDWVPYLAKQFRSFDSDDQTRLAALVALANISENERGAREPGTQSILKEALKLGPAKYSPIQRQQIARLAANISSFGTYNTCLSSAIPVIILEYLREFRGDLVD